MSPDQSLPPVAPPPRHGMRARRTFGLLAVVVLAMPAARGETRGLHWNDGLVYRGEGWMARLGLQLSADSGEAMADDAPAAAAGAAGVGAAGANAGGGTRTVLRHARPSLAVTFSPRWSARLDYELGDVGRGVKNGWLQWRAGARTSVRVGSQFAPFGLENAMSSDSMPWTERSLASALTAAALTGASLRTSGERWTFSGGLYANDIADDDRRSYRGRSAIARLTAVPLRRDGHLWHVGLSGEYRQGESGAELRIRPRPETFTTDRRLIDSRRLAGVDSLATLGIETAYRRGPLLLQAEYLRSQVQRAGAAGGPAAFDGGYVSASWMITGERRSYSESGGAFGGVKPLRTFGAFELALRASRLDLDDGSVTGGAERNLAATLNWYGPRYGRVSLTWIDATATRAVPLAPSGQYLALRAELAF